MKITLKYEESALPDLQMTLRLTLPQKYVNGPTKEVVKLFVDHYNKKHAEAPLDAEALHLKIVGGNHLNGDARVKDTMADKDECYLLGASSLASSGPSGAAVCPPCKATSEPSKAGAKQPQKDEQGRVRCKRFGCNKFFDPDGPDQPCQSHKSPPIFHETAKWWSCCPDKKAYDWEEFMRIPGCQETFCSTNPEGQKDQKRFLGGADLRGDTAPQRIDVDAPADPRHKLTDLMKGAVACGVDKALFERVWAKLASENDDLEKVCDIFRMRFAGALNEMKA